ncbi:unnamed protein product [Soboliphyme baturini]|uniref:Cation_ATPase_N domain-containing protein n=1 Tax=Soboliphyme baturini TaxID=241478 RepID=A0A183ISN3_9BILA|nr:unnamed protein product [Soboliphyme baturini]
MDRNKEIRRRLRSGQLDDKGFENEDQRSFAESADTDNSSSEELQSADLNSSEEPNSGVPSPSEESHGDNQYSLQLLDSETRSTPEDQPDEYQLSSEELLTRDQLSADGYDNNEDSLSEELFSVDQSSESEDEEKPVEERLTVTYKIEDQMLSGKTVTVNRLRLWWTYFLRKLRPDEVQLETVGSHPKETSIEEHKISLEDLRKKLKCNFEEGLTDAEAEQRLLLHGQNILSPPPVTPEWLKFVKTLFGGFACLLWTGSILCFSAYIFQASSSGQETVEPDNLYLGIVLALVVIVTAVFQYYQEAQSYRIIESFKKLIPTLVLIGIIVFLQMGISRNLAKSAQLQWHILMF